MKLKEGEVYQSKESGRYYKVVKINGKYRRIQMLEVHERQVLYLYHSRLKIELPLWYANEILKPVPKLKKILLLELWK